MIVVTFFASPAYNQLTFLTPQGLLGCRSEWPKQFESSLVIFCEEVIETVCLIIDIDVCMLFYSSELNIRCYSVIRQAGKKSYQQFSTRHHSSTN